MAVTEIGKTDFEKWAKRLMEEGLSEADIRVRIANEKLRQEIQRREERILAEFEDGVDDAA